MKERILGRGLAITLALAFSLMILAAAIYLPATSAWIMRPLMVHFAPPEVTGLPAEEYAPVVDMITGYLKGDEGPFQHEFMVNGAGYAVFNAKEQHHMADVQGLFGLCRWIMWGCAGAACLLGLILRRQMRWRAFRRTLIGVLAAVAVIALLAAIDFNGLFVLFHKIAFTNDLWLLNPRTDMLIRLMPLDFFISYVAIIGGIWLAGMALMMGASVLLQRLLPKE